MSQSMYFFVSGEAQGTDGLDDKFVSSNPQGEDRSAEPLHRFAGRYWFVEVRRTATPRRSSHEALSTEEIAAALDSNCTVRSISGPFRTWDEASQSLERLWERRIYDGD